jgi:multiple sugar transport system permease protein
VAQQRVGGPGSGTTQPAHRTWLTERRREAIAGYLFAAPWLAGLIGLTAIPALASLYLSFTEYQLVQPPAFIGLDNFRQLFTTDPRFVKALLNTGFMVAIGVPIQMAVGLAVALLLNQRVRGLAIYRTIFFLPSQVTGVAVALMWGWVLNPQFGVVAQVLDRAGILAPLWLVDPDWVKPAFILMGLWSIGTSMVIWLAGLQSIPEIYYEAAALDGAGPIRRFLRITMPLLSPTTFFVLITSTIGTFQIFTQAFVLTKGGPNDASLFYALYIYEQAYRFFRMGYAASLAWVLFVIVLLLTLLNLRLAKTWVHYEAVKE